MAATSPVMNMMIRAAEKAAKSLIRDFGEAEQLQVSLKGPSDFVSAADKRAEKIIFDELQKSYPDWSFLMEESGEIKGKDGERRFIIDPLDGTANFLHGIPQWSISIGLEVKGELVAGLVYDPVRDEMFMAEKNGGAFLRKKRLRVSGRGQPEMSVIVTGAPRRAKPKDSHDQFFREQRAVWDAGFALRRMGSAALDICYVAAGRYEGYWERDLKAWDIAAGLIILREAGGFYCGIDKDNEKLLETGNVLAANGKLLETLKKTLRAA